jgi:hypothetical protein
MLLALNALLNTLTYVRTARGLEAKPVGQDEVSRNEKSMGSVKLYDRLGVPITRSIESVGRPPFEFTFNWRERMTGLAEFSG